MTGGRCAPRKAEKMGREVRRVPADWQHPTDAQGHLIPLHDRFPYNAEEVQEGLEDGWLVGEPPWYGVGVMPQWPDAERTHLQMYETTTEGTPISPVCATAEALATWLVEHDASVFGDSTTSYAHWLAIIRGGDPGLPVVVRAPAR